MELPGVAVHDSLFVSLRSGIAVPSRARAQNYPKQQNNQRIVRGYSRKLLSADRPLESELAAVMRCADKMQHSLAETLAGRAECVSHEIFFIFWLNAPAMCVLM